MQRNHHGHSSPEHLLELGHANPIQALRFEGDRVLSADNLGHWVLWNYTSGALLASGDGLQPNLSSGTPAVKQIDMAGQTVVVGVANALEIRALSDGRLISLIVYPGLGQPPLGGINPPWWQLASDGSYICIGSQTGLFVFTPTGQTAVSKAGDYSLAMSFAAPGEIHSRPGASRPKRAGNSLDGRRHLLCQPCVLRAIAYSCVCGWPAVPDKRSKYGMGLLKFRCTSQAIVALPTIDNLTGQGNWIWTYGPTRSGISASKNISLDSVP